MTDTTIPAETPADRAMAASQPERLATLVAVMVTVLAVAATLARLLFSVEFADEPTYAALAYRFALGARPFASELDPHQIAALLTTPWVWLHLHVFGGTFALLLSLRVLWALLQGASAVLAFLVLRRLIDWRLALVACACGFALMPYMIPAPSYNTLGVIFGSVGVSLVALGVLDRARWIPFALAGVAFGLAAVAYQTLAVAALGAAAGAWLLTRSWRTGALVLAGEAFVAAVLAASLAPFASGLPHVLAYTTIVARATNWAGAQQGGLLGKLAETIWIQLKTAALQVSTYVTVAIAAMLGTRRRVPVLLAAALPLSLLLNFSMLPELRTLSFAVSVLFVAAVLAFSARADSLDLSAPEGLAVLRFAAAYAILAGLAFALTSSLGWIYLSLGAASAFALLLGVVFACLQTASRREPLGGWAPLLSVGLACALLLALVACDWTASYRDLAPAGLTTMVRSGPYAGLITTAENARDIEGLGAALSRYGAQDRLLAYNVLPAAYLFTPAAPALPAVWVSPWDATAPEFASAWLGELKANPPTVVVKNLGWPDRATFLQFLDPTNYDPRRERIEAWVEANYRVAARGKHWAVLVPKR